MGRTAGRSSLARCPFYRMDSRMTVTCEGLVDRSTLQIRFAAAQDCAIQMRTFCCRHYDRCEIFRAITEAKYMEE